MTKGIIDKFKRYHCIKQHDITDCGAACLATISKQYGLKIPISKIREVAGTDKQGTNAYGLIKAAEKLSFTAKGDRKSTRLNSSHVAISYAVFCLKKKNK